MLEDFEPEELELQSSTRASPVISRDNDVIISNEIPPIVPEKYTAAAAGLREEECEDKFKNCNIVVQAHLCVYSFYQSNCCRSCRDITTQSWVPPSSLSQSGKCISLTASASTIVTLIRKLLVNSNRMRWKTQGGEEFSLTFGWDGAAVKSVNIIGLE